jgi:hypothetical protein
MTAAQPRCIHLRPKHPARISRSNADHGIVAGSAERAEEPHLE